MDTTNRLKEAHAATRTCSAGANQPRHCHSLACRSKAIGTLRTVRQGGG